MTKYLAHKKVTKFQAKADYQGQERHSSVIEETQRTSYFAILNLSPAILSVVITQSWERERKKIAKYSIAKGEKLDAALALFFEIQFNLPKDLLHHLCDLRSQLAPILM